MIDTKNNCGSRCQVILAVKFIGIAAIVTGILLAHYKFNKEISLGCILSGSVFLGISMIGAIVLMCKKCSKERERSSLLLPEKQPNEKLLHQNGKKAGESQPMTSASPKGEVSKGQIVIITKTEQEKIGETPNAYHFAEDL